MKLVFPVRLVDPERVTQTTASDVSESGAFVHTTSRPAEGTLLALGLYLPDALEPLALSATVLGSRDAAGRRGFSTEFGRHADGRRRLTNVLRVAEQVAAANLRTSRRIHVDLVALIPSPRGVLVVQVRDIGPSGMFIEMTDMPAVGTLLPVMLDLPDGRPPAMVTVEVVRQQHARYALPTGVGVQFIDAADDFRERLDRLLTSNGDDTVAAPSRVSRRVARVPGGGP
jgi:hypothetical protein